VGTTATQQYLESDFAQNQAAVVEWTTGHVDVAPSGELAIQRGTWSVRNAGPDGTGTDSDR
jgi:hypothetical protein